MEDASLLSTPPPGRAALSVAGAVTVLMLAAAQVPGAAAHGAPVPTGLGVSRHAPAPGSSGAHTVACEGRRGRTVLSRGVVRVFSEANKVWGCVRGNASAWELWEPTAGWEGAVRQVAGTYVAVEKAISAAGSYRRSLSVTDLLSGSVYVVAHLERPLAGGAESSEPQTPGPWPLEAFALAPDGYTARLYDTFAAGAGSGAKPTGQVLDLVGPQSSQRELASGPPGAIAPASLSCAGRTVRWSQSGAARSAGV